MKKLFLMALFITLPFGAHAKSGTPKATTAELRCLANNMYYEARGEGTMGMIAVGQVTINRVVHRGWRDTICGVVYQPKQFSWVGHVSYEHEDREAWDKALMLATMLLQPERYHFHNTGATHFITKHLHQKVMSGKIRSRALEWVKVTPVVEHIGNHVFLA